MRIERIGRLRGGAASGIVQDVRITTRSPEGVSLPEDAPRDVVVEGAAAVICLACLQDQWKWHYAGTRSHLIEGMIALLGIIERTDSDAWMMILQLATAEENEGLTWKMPEA